MTEIAKEAGAKWRNLDEGQKIKYRQQYLNSKAVYEDQTSTIKLTHRQLTLASLLRKNDQIISGKANRRILSDEERSLLLSLPKPPAMSGRNLFMQEGFKQTPAIGKPFGASVQQMKQLSFQWSNLSESEKDFYKEKAKTARLQFLNDLQAIK